ncbi:uncharacterized protein PG986_009402 [Apiospora aurea]|uniref:Uncharacterized protein n=1 Tax=Apiospora aurea TaxID=335848 RepID=A0ABR1Q7K3_9PEZI
MSDHTYWAWDEARNVLPSGPSAAKDIEFIASVMIRNDVTQKAILAIQRDRAVGANKCCFESTEANAPYWKELVGSSAGGPRYRMLMGYHASAGN